MAKLKEKQKKKVAKKDIKKSNKKNVKANKIKQHITQVVTLSVIIFAVIFCAYKIIKLAIKPTDSFLIEQGKVEQAESVIGYVIRDEKVIQMPDESKKMIQIKNEGERVSVGEEVFRYEATNEEELNSKIKDLNNQIQTAMEGQVELPSSDIKALEKQIESKINGIKDKNNLQDIKEYKSDINGYITKKAKIAGELSPSGAYINNLINERISLEKQLKNNSKYEKATIGGIVSYRVDGLESKLTPESFKEITKESLEGLNLTTGQIVTTSETMGKIINNFECYIAVVTNSNSAKNASVGDKVKLRIICKSNNSSNYSTYKTEDKDTLLIFKITQSVEYLTSYRKISLDIIWWEENGLRVPNSSIIFENGLSYVIRTKSGLLDKILVKVIKDNNNYSIITNYSTSELKEMGHSMEDIKGMKKISIYDEILADPDIEEVSKKLN